MEEDFLLNIKDYDFSFDDDRKRTLLIRTSSIVVDDDGTSRITEVEGRVTGSSTF